MGKLTVPRTGYEFERKLEALKTPKEICEYLDLLDPAKVPKLLSQDLSVDILMKVCDGLTNASLSGGAAAGLSLMTAFSKVNRFDIILDFLSEQEKTAINGAFANLDAPGV